MPDAVMLEEVQKKTQENRQTGQGHAEGQIEQRDAAVRVHVSVQGADMGVLLKGTPIVLSRA